MSADRDVFALLRTVLTYPGAGYAEAARRLASASDHAAEFAEFVERSSPHELEERYAATFDVDPDCTLDLGWHLFGEDYNRGLFLAKLRREMAAVGMREEGELPDHLPRLLVLLERMRPEDAARLAGACVLPAIEKMAGALGGKNSPFAGPVRAAGEAVRGRFGLNAPARPPAAAPAPGGG